MQTLESPSLSPRGPGPFIWEVGALVLAVADALGARFGTVVVRGEIGSFTRAASGHCYFMLKDESGAAAVRCVMFRRAATLLDFAPADGAHVEVRGRLAVYEARGELQLVVEGMRRGGAGALMEQFLRLKARLEAEGLFATARKRPLPVFPRRVGVITSLATAALHDVATALARRATHCGVIIYPAAVQGSDAPPQLVRAIQVANRRAEVDLLIVCRGGGSIEDLWSFNDERVVRAIVASALPVISAVGHETDFTLADFAADLRAPTPTAGAELAAPALRDVRAALEGLGQRLVRSSHRRLDAEAQRMDRASLKLRRPAEMLARHGHALALLEQRQRSALAAALRSQRQGLRQAGQRLQRGASALLALRQAALHALRARTEALDPRRIVARGYAMLETAGGALVVRPDQLHDGQDLRVTLAHGAADLHVERARPVAPAEDARDVPETRHVPDK